MKIFYDWEFVEDGYTISPLSVGMVAEDGRELYFVLNNGGTITRAVANDWLRQNVVRHLPVAVGPRLETGGGWSWVWDDRHSEYEAVVSRAEMRLQVEQFIRDTDEPELWAWYGAYDHVCYAQLFGRMIDLPEGLPMWTGDLKQEAVRLGDPRIPPRLANGAQFEHHALHDAREDAFRYVWLRDYATEGPF